MLRITLTVVVGLLLAGPAMADEYVWLEGEDATSHDFNQHSWYTNTDIRKDLLSPGKPGGAKGSWLTHFDNKGSTAKASWSSTITEGGDYTVWLRCNPHKTVHVLKIDGGAEQPVDLTSDPRERINLIAPKIDLRFLAWIKAATVKLEPGKHTIELSASKGDNGQSHAGVDALVLSNFAWAPSGAAKPAAAGAPKPGPDDWFPLFPSDDPFAASSATDVSHLLHTPAGKHGALGRDGAKLQFADGTPVKITDERSGLLSL